MRAVATNKAKPALASQAENARSNMAEDEKFVESNWRVHRERAIKRDSIIPSRQRRAERRWVR